MKNNEDDGPCSTFKEWLNLSGSKFAYNGKYSTSEYCSDALFSAKIYQVANSHTMVSPAQVNTAVVPYL